MLMGRSGKCRGESTWNSLPTRASDPGWPSGQLTILTAMFNGNEMALKELICKSGLYMAE